MALGIDIGTSEVRTVLVDAAGQVLGQAGEALPISRLQPLCSQHDPADWWQATVTALGRLRDATADRSRC